MKALPVLVLVLSAVPLDALAAPTPAVHTFVPSNPTTADVVRLRTDLQGCYSIFGAVTVLPDEPAIEVRFEGSDIPCEPGIPANMETPRFADVGTLPAGRYATRIYSCGFGPLGTTCDLIQAGSLVVRGIGATPHTVPVASTWAALLLASSLLLAGFFLRTQAIDSG